VFFEPGIVLPEPVYCSPEGDVHNDSTQLTMSVYLQCT
jgi:hypothetical protein